MKILNVVGARPNFMKIAPIVDERKRRKLSSKLVHTGQHYDEGMSDVFFRDSIPAPIFISESVRKSRRTDSEICGIEKVCLDESPTSLSWSAT